MNQRSLTQLSRGASAALLVLTLALGGCSRGHDHAHDHGNKEKKSHAGHAHTHDAKHGGVALVLGEEAYHIEFTYGETPGVLQAYFLDGEMENYVRVAAPSFATIAKMGDEEKPLVFHATTNSATGETVGNSALFEARADWLVGKPLLKLSIPTITVKSSTYTNLIVPLSGSPKTHAHTTP
jgi:hypothetical protein